MIDQDGEDEIKRIASKAVNYLSPNLGAEEIEDERGQYKAALIKILWLLGEEGGR